jgi:hypothetical protein
MKRWVSPLLAVLLFVFAACGETEGDGTNNGDTNAGANANTGSIAEVCETTGNAVADAIRALPRDCEIDSDCRIVERAGNCECANSVNADGDIASFEAALADLDENMCVHPFASCGATQCDYERGYRESELIGQCIARECVVTETMKCEEFVDNIYGGLVPPSRCETADDCTLRSDLNPCGCTEAVGVNFPFLAAQATFDLISINQRRCVFSCDACPQVTEATCEQNVCIAR